MGLAPGARLGPYEIVAPIGAGGMGEVYAARDTRLWRTVAVKILSPEFASDAKLRIRFEREAKAISALNHPHICVLYDVGPGYLVMEHCEGKTLAKVIAGGRLSLPQIIDYGTQIADALDKAHRAGIVHRDLKPSNIMVTKSGVKLLDFGLAKQRSDSSPDESTAQQVTEEGKILGTIQYMAPEVLHGKEADARSDIFALGLVLYEMASGKPAFSGTSKASLIAAILEHEVPPLEGHPLLDRVIRECLAKDPEERIQTAHDVMLQLRWLMETEPRPQRVMRWTWKLATALLLIAVAVAAVGITHLMRELAAAGQPMHTVMSAPADALPMDGIGYVMAWSPDGTHVAMIVGTNANPALAVHDLTKGQTRTLSGTEGAFYPFWSPDGRRIGFFANGKLETIDAEGGAVQVLADAPGARGGAWSASGVIVFAPGMTGPLLKVSEGGGAAVPVTHANPSLSHRLPVFLPDGETFLYVSFRIGTWTPDGIYAGSLNGEVEKRIVEHGSNAVYVGDRLLYVSNRNLVAQRFDPTKLVVSGTPVVIDKVEYWVNLAQGNFSATARQIAYVPPVTALRQIIAVDPKTGETTTIGSPGEYTLDDLSKDGRQLLVSIGDSGGLFLMSPDRGIPTRIESTQSSFDGRFSPDGKRIALLPRDERLPLVIQSLEDGSRETVYESPVQKYIGCWSADGTKILLTSYHEGAGINLEILDLRTRTLRLLMPTGATGATEGAPALSPDDRWLSYMSNGSGRFQVYVTRFGSPGPKWQISVESGGQPQWTPDGKKLYFLSDAKLYVVDVRDGPTPQFGRPAPVPLSVDPSATYDITYFVAPDGRIITTRPAGDRVPRSIHVITNWTKLLP